MRTATGLALLAFGAVLAFAVNADIPGFNLAAAGWIVMLTGAVGLFMPARASGWVRRRVLLKEPVPAARRSVEQSPATAAKRPPAAIEQAPAATEPAPAAAVEQAPAAAKDLRDPAAVAAQILEDAQVVAPGQRAADDYAPSQPTSGPGSA